MPFTAAVIDKTHDGVVPEHPRLVQQARLVEAWRRLPGHYRLAYCTGCDWFVRVPARLCTADDLARRHMLSAHFSALLNGQAHVSSDLAAGFEGFLAERLAQVVGL